MVNNIFEDFEPPFKNFVATPLDHPNKYSYEIPHETCWGEGTNLFPKAIFKSSLPLIEKRCARDKVGWGNLSGKTILIKRNLWFVLGFFFSNGAFLSLWLFQNSFIFGEASSSHFFRATTSAQQLLFRSSYFFRTAAFFEELLFLEQSFIRSSYFFRVAYFSENLYLTAPSWEKKVF